MSFSVRLALAEDVPALSALIETSVRTLQAGDYSAEQIEFALRHVFGVDSQLIADRTYFVVQEDSGVIVGCGGWSKRRTLYGGDAWSAREDSLSNPATDAAKIRAFFVHPSAARQGVGTLILTACESAALQAGFTRFEMGATLTGAPLYRARGYSELEHVEVPLVEGVSLPIVRMEKRVDPSYFACASRNSSSSS